MRIRWTNVIVAILGVAACVLFLRHQHAISSAWDSIFRLGPGYPEEDKFVGVIALGVVGVCVIALVKIVINNRGN